jgi:hypothetical protein
MANDEQHYDQRLARRVVRAAVAWHKARLAHWEYEESVLDTPCAELRVDLIEDVVEKTRMLQRATEMLMLCGHNQGGE